MSTTALMTATTTASSATATCTTAVPGKYGRVPVDACNSNYYFDPSFAANLAFCMLFGLTTIAHLAQARFCWVAIMGATWETIAFAFKTLGSHDQQNLTYLTVGQILFLLAPLWINAFVYMGVARMVYFGMPSQKLLGIKAVRMTLLFVWLDVILFLVQGTGGVMLSNTDADSDTIDIGMKVYMAGVALQLAVVLVFSGITVFFYFKLRQLEGRSMGCMKWLIWTMVAVLMLIVTRIVYRLVEFGPGVNAHNTLLIHEGYPLGLDATPILIALVLLNIMHPGFVLRGPESEFPKLSRKEKKALKEQKKQAKKDRKAGVQQLEELSIDKRSSSSRQVV
ncbi:unnamed protein product [Fusarium graminearum]|uniref:Chromosome 3, complete genome n=1 Tax=Gibberella zeae (strain ATCC MYA-4620 / CBS 123657 / FGSC 9075 / NRRL 31084 / PH-1) TaxID=229533 RepID=A0A1C3YJQ4_GIBZE|nr:hypothetical protein HG531_003362 [Fusarium graminearum]CAF3511044.1 unnamed protein product [Fusarium graminearum]CAG1961862.1 unnamed protein product [Fusarium graminearum]CAG1968259.1 unnamed protein product [Fusarium graminearum]SCB64722.1 unnamed protein product [Fusarium graminearum]